MAAGQESVVQLALGTAQFGVAYGVAGRGQVVPEPEVRGIFEHAATCGIRVLDTAPAYGAIEARLGSLLEGLDFEVVSKISALPAAVAEEDARQIVDASIARSVDRLGSRLTTLLFHRGEDLLGPHGDALWGTAQSFAGAGLRIGVSCYDPGTLVELRRRYPITVAQVPGNALDQRLAASDRGSISEVDIHLRSVFLQGLLLLPAIAARERVPAASGAIARWADWCASLRIGPIAAALATARAVPGVRLCVVGVDREAQLKEILVAWDITAPPAAKHLACDDLDVIDPRRWAAH
ncbi:MAG: aldo/keto reductase [Vicinamibacterales bacterium]